MNRTEQCFWRDKWQHLTMRPGLSMFCFPSPRPSPLGRGRIVVRVLTFPKRHGFHGTMHRCPLSLGERVRVRGNGPSRCILTDSLAVS